MYIRISMEVLNRTSSRHLVASYVYLSGTPLWVCLEELLRWICLDMYRLYQGTCLYIIYTIQGPKAPRLVYRDIRSIMTMYPGNWWWGKILPKSQYNNYIVQYQICICPEMEQSYWFDTRHVIWLCCEIICTCVHLQICYTADKGYTVEYRSVIMNFVFMRIWHIAPLVYIQRF